MSDLKSFIDELDGVVESNDPKLTVKKLRIVGPQVIESLRVLERDVILPLVLKKTGNKVFDAKLKKEIAELDKSRKSLRKFLKTFFPELSKSI